MCLTLLDVTVIVNLTLIFKDCTGEGTQLLKIKLTFPESHFFSHKPELTLKLLSNHHLLQFSHLGMKNLLSTYNKFSSNDIYWMISNINSNHSSF